MNLKEILGRDFLKSTETIDKILSGELKYSEMTEEQDTAVYHEGWHLLIEYDINLGNVYQSEKKSYILGIFYSFRDAKNKLHFTKISNDFVVKIGPAADNSSVDGKIITRKIGNFNDSKLLNTHILNIIKYVEENHPKELIFQIESSDKYKESRKRLFVGIAGKMPEYIKDIKVYDDVVILYLKYG